MSETIVGIVAGVLTSVSMLPQLIKVIKSKNADTLSPLMLLVLIAGVLLWTCYGILKDELPIAITNGLAVIINSILLVCYFKYRR